MGSSNAAIHLGEVLASAPMELPVTTPISAIALCRKGTRGPLNCLWQHRGGSPAWQMAQPPQGYSPPPCPLQATPSALCHCSADLWSHHYHQWLLHLAANLLLACSLLLIAGKGGGEHLGPLCSQLFLLWLKHRNIFLLGVLGIDWSGQRKVAM